MNVNDALWHEVFERDRGMCQYCGMDLLASFELYQSATLDHVVARAIDGKSELANLVLSCTSCNTRLSRAHKHTTVAERKAYLSQSNQGARDVYAQYLQLKADNWSSTK